MKYIILILALLLPPSAPPFVRAEWIHHTLFHVTWAAPGWHCAWIDHLNGIPSQALTCQTDGANVAFGIGGIDHAYRPYPGDRLRLVDAAGVVVATGVVPAQEYRVILNWVRR
jgi:hypothetical protein